MFLFDAHNDKLFGLAVIAGLTLFGVGWWSVVAIRDRRREAAYLRAVRAYGDAVVAGYTADQLALTEWRLKQDVPLGWQSRFALLCELMRQVKQPLTEVRSLEQARRMIERSG